MSSDATVDPGTGGYANPLEVISDFPTRLPTDACRPTIALPMPSKFSVLLVRRLFTIQLRETISFLCSFLASLLNPCAKKVLNSPNTTPA